MHREVNTSRIVTILFIKLRARRTPNSYLQFV